MAKKKRESIPNDIAARSLFISDRTCCVCRMSGKPVQIHHVDEDPSNNLIKNLAILCFDCHRDTQIRGGFDRKLDADQVLLYRDDWHQIVTQRRANYYDKGSLIHQEHSFEIEVATSVAEWTSPIMRTVS